MNNSVNACAPIERTSEETIAELARSVRKAGSRPEAFNALRRLAREVDWDDIDDSGSVLLDLARLWAFFLPKPTPRARSPFDWCAKAIGKDDVRYYLNFVYVTEDEIVGTDGHSLHIVPNAEGREPGFYGPEGVRLHAPDYARYPDFKRVQPDTRMPRQWFDVQQTDLEIGTMATKDNSVLNYYKLPTMAGWDHEARVHVDAKLVKRLFSMNPDEVVGINVGGMGDSVLVKLAGERIAVLMPLRQ